MILESRRYRGVILSIRTLRLATLRYARQNDRDKSCSSSVGKSPCSPSPPEWLRNGVKTSMKRVCATGYSNTEKDKSPAGEKEHDQSQDSSNDKQRGVREIR